MAIFKKWNIISKNFIFLTQTEHIYIDVNIFVAINNYKLKGYSMARHFSTLPFTINVAVYLISSA